MTGFETLERAIPRGSAEAVAGFLGVHSDEVRRWRREPTSDEQPQATGRRSPLDRGCDLITAVFLESPNGAELIVEHFRSHLARLKANQSKSELLSPSEIEHSLSEISRTVLRALDSLRANDSR